MYHSDTTHSLTAKFLHLEGQCGHMTMSIPAAVFFCSSVLQLSCVSYIVRLGFVVTATLLVIYRPTYLELLVPAKGRWFSSAAGKVTVGLALHWPCATDFSGLSTYGLMAKVRATPCTPIRSWSALPLPFFYSRWRWLPYSATHMFPTCGVTCWCSDVSVWYSCLFLWCVFCRNAVSEELSYCYHSVCSWPCLQWHFSS